MQMEEKKHIKVKLNCKWEKLHMRIKVKQNWKIKTFLKFTMQTMYYKKAKLSNSVDNEKF